ncbi:hypothetical protein ACGFNX_28215 [Streptomyces sp. NPDC048723]
MTMTFKDRAERSARQADATRAGLATWLAEVLNTAADALPELRGTP